MPRPAPSAITRTFRVSIALAKNSINYLHKFIVIGWIGTKKRRLKSQSAGESDAGGASSSQLSKTSSGRTVNLRLRYFAISKAFFLLESSRYLYCGCLVMSNLSLKNGLTPCTCKMHLPPSITDNSSVDISSLLHCQVKNSFFIAFSYMESCRCSINVLN